MGTKSKWKWTNGRLCFYNNAVVDENVVTTTSNGPITSYGLSVLKFPALGVVVLDPPASGVVKNITVISTDFVYIRSSTVEDAVTFAGAGTNTTSIHTLKLTPDNSSAVNFPANVSLRAISTAKWAITGAGCVGTTLNAIGNSVVFCTGHLATTS